MMMKRSAQRPVRSSISSIGFAPSSSLNASHTSSPSGASAAAKTSGLITLVRRELGLLSVVPAQIHSRVHPRHLVAVAVEHERAAPEELPDPALFVLAPARMIDFRIHV